MHSVTCKLCGRVFLTEGSARLCSDACRKQRARQIARAYYERKGIRLQRNPATLRPCEACGKPFAAFPGERLCDVCRTRKRPEPAPIRSISPEAEALARYVEEHY